MEIAKIEEKVKALTENLLKETLPKNDFIYEFLLIFGFTKMMIKRLKEGNSNLSKSPNQVIIKQKLFYEFAESSDIYSLIDNLKKDSKTYTHKPRFIVVTDFKTLLAIDTKTEESLDTPINELHKHVSFFFPWLGKEKYVAHQENPADVRAAEKMARIYDEIVANNPDLTQNHNHALNVFLTRLLFCFFAEDTNIFEDGIFTNTLKLSKDDGSDLDLFLDQLFESLDKQDKSSYPTYLQKFPYVNGKLFSEKQTIPKMNSKIRNLMIDCGEQDWKEINPDIFGSMFQAVASAEIRSGLGQHYTSVPNIMKVIEPLFLNDLREELEKSDTEKKLRNLLNRIYGIKIFDPACGSGNFLIIAYKQLRLLEIDIIKKIQDVTGQGKLILSQIKLSQFYGIEIDDFACEIATLSLWLAEHQMNTKFRNIFGDCNPSLPLKASGQIKCANATRIDWEEICPKKTEDKYLVANGNYIVTDSGSKLIVGSTPPEIYILGNPPYLGARLQSASQKEDMSFVFNNKIDGFNNLDYIACWFKKAVDYILNINAYFAFVTTNSICQGSQVALLWQNLLTYNVEIHFAHQAFKWGNNAKNKAGVTCVIIGMRNIQNKPKYLIDQDISTDAKNINGYLTDFQNIIVEKSSKTISKLPKMCFGSMPNDNGNLIFSSEQRDYIVAKYPNISNLFKRLLGSQEFIRGEIRYCLWIDDARLDIIKNIPELMGRINNVKKYRLESKREATNKLANKAHRFGEVRHQNTNSIIIPSVSSERREYIPIGFLNEETIISNLALAIYNAESWIFGILTSKMHMVWVKSIGGYLGTSIRYSAEICYNPFPFPNIDEKQKKIIEMHVNEVLAEREKHPEKTMAELYDPDKMPEGLRKAHQSLDIAIELCYRKRPFESDEKRLEYLFKMYEIMTNPSKSSNAEQQLSLI